MLDVGCGSDAMVNDLSVGLRIGLDPLMNAVKLSLSSNVVGIQGVGEYLPFQKEDFDVVTCINVFDHMYVPFKALKEMKRILKKNGICMQ